MNRTISTVAGVLLLAWLWSGRPGVGLPGPFTSHMVVHMGVVAIAAPLLALGIAGTRLDPLHGRCVGSFTIAAAALEFVVIWGWHTPGLHDAARVSAPMFVFEQAAFLVSGVLVWLSALGGTGDGKRVQRAAGVFGLLLTSMHMSLLGALIALAPRPLYRCTDMCRAQSTLGPLDDQALGGTVMLAIGGSVYLLGGLMLLAKTLQQHPARSAKAERTGVP